MNVKAGYSWHVHGLTELPRNRSFIESRKQMYKIIIIEDDVCLREQVTGILQNYGYEVYAVTDFKNVLGEVDRIKPDIALLDINLPYMDGNYYCQAIRKKYHMPIIITSARNSDTDQILSMELGSDDYVIKPFNINVLLSRISACLRRTYGAYNDRIQSRAGGILLDDDGMKLEAGGKSVMLSKNEYRLLKVFIDMADKVVSREMLLDAIWDDKDFVDDNTLTVNVTRIKKKLESLGYENVIQTKRGIGYMFSTEGIE